jgi:hypothetical protein
MGEQSCFPVSKAAFATAFTPEEEAMIQDTMGRRRPLGITIISIIVAILGILDIIGGIRFLSVSPTQAIITIILGVLGLVLAWGLWTLQSWAFWALVIVAILNVINGIVAWVGHNPGPGVVSIVISLIILGYMFADRNVRAAFRT